MSKVLVSETNLVAIGDAIREKNGESTKYKPGEMAAAISAITTGGGGDIEIPVITGDCSDRFTNNGWNWVVESFGNEMTTQDISSCYNMFRNSTDLERIPFEINCKEGTDLNCQYMFYACNKLKEIPKINNCKVNNIQYLFSQCDDLREVPEDIADWFDWSLIDNATSSTTCRGVNQIFTGCHSLRSIPMGMLSHENPVNTSYLYSIYYRGFDGCMCLNEVIDVPIHEKHISNKQTTNMFSSTFTSCSRLKNFTFKSYATDTVPIRPVKWKSQVIDLSQAGYAIYKFYILSSYDTGITPDKEITDDATYQALKDDPDCFTVDVKYSRYNHDSAVRTINSLPDTSAYLTEAGGTNTIKFKGQSGELTDGGAINTLTEEEIAVATARGWTVTLV